MGSAAMAGRRLPHLPATQLIASNIQLQGQEPPIPARPMRGKSHLGQSTKRSSFTSFSACTTSVACRTCRHKSAQTY